VRKYHIANAAVMLTSITRFPTATLRIRSSRNGINGAPLRASTATNAASATSPASSGTSAPASPQPCDSVCPIPYASAPTPVVTSSVPGRSIRGRRPAASGSGTRSRASTSAPTATPIGTLISSTQRHDR
jgi:hypothetical protein